MGRFIFGVITMLSNDLSTGFIVFLFFMTIFCILLVGWQAKVSNYCRDMVAVVMNQNKRAVSLRKIAEIEATLTDLTDSYDSLLMQHKKLRSRIGMRNLRESRKNGVDSEPETPEMARARLKAQLREKAKLT